MRSTPARLVFGTLAALALAGACWLSGCSYVAAAAYVIEGPPKVEAVFELDDEKKTVLLVDDRGSVLPRRSLRRVIGEDAEQTILAAKALSPELTIPSSATLAVMSQEKRDSPRSVVDIGREVGADVIVYVEMTGFSISRDGATSSPLVAASVKVFDVAANKRLWPAGPEGYPLTYAPPMRSANLPASFAERIQQEDAAAKKFGVAIGQLFYQHERSQSVARAQP